MIFTDKGNEIRVFVNDAGVEQKAYSGVYRKADGTIRIDMNTYNSRGLTLNALSHELTHFIQQWSEAKYKALADFLIENYENGRSMDELVRAKQADLARKRGQKVSYDEAYSEVIADSMEAMLADGNVIEKIMELKAKDSDLVAKIKQFFDNLLAKIRNVYNGLTPDSAEGKAVLEMKDSIEKIQQLFAEALVDASENFQTAEVQKNTTEDGGEEEIKESIRRTQKMSLTEQLSAYYSKDPNKRFKQSDAFYFGVTPDILSKSNLDASPLAMGQDDFKKSTADKHNIPRRVLKNLHKDISDPVFSFTAGKQSAIMTKDIDGDGKPLVVAIHGGHTMDRLPINRIASIYGVDDMADWVGKQIKGGCKFRVYDIGKANAMLQTHGYLAAVGTQSDGFWDIITEKKTGVNTESVEAMDLEVDAGTESVAPAVLKSERNNPYSYETLIGKPDMLVTTVDGNVPKNRADVVYQAKQNAAKVGKFDPKTGSVSVRVEDIDADVIIGRDGLKHSLDRRFDVNAPVVLKVGEILANSIRINELTPQKAEAAESYVLIGTAKNELGEMYVVRSVVNRFSNELTSMDVLYAINAKKEPAALLPLSTGKPALGTDSTISIASLLDYVNEYFPDILPEDMLKHYGHDSRPEGKLGESALYQDRADESVSNRSLLANALESTVKDDKEKQKLREYREQIEHLDAEEQKLRELNGQIKELSFAKGKRDTKKISALRDEATKTANRINIYDKRLLRLEASKPLQDVLDREKKKAYKRAEQKGKEALAAYKEKATKEQKELVEKWQVSRKKGNEICNSQNSARLKTGFLQNS